MRKKKLIGCALALLLLPFVILFIICFFLYMSADMKTPEHDVVCSDSVVVADGVRHYGGNWMRKSDDGLFEMYVHGAPFDLGMAIGKLAEPEIYYQEKVFVDQIHRIIPSDSYLKFLRNFIAIFNRNLGENVPAEFREEIFGISQSCTHDYDAIGSPYERQLNYHSAHDLGHAMQDYMLVGCSSFAVWNDYSADSSLLIGRNFDFYMGDDFARNKLVSFVRPDSGYCFAAVGWPAMIGVLSGMNEKGLTVTINAAKSDMPTSSATPISILARTILQYAANIEQAYDIASRYHTFVSESILIGSAADGCAAVIEKSPEKMALFSVPVSDGHIVCTNHYQSGLYKDDPHNVENIETSDSPVRFNRIKKLVAEKKPLDVDAVASVLRDSLNVDGSPVGLSNEMAVNQFIAHHSVVFKPEKLLLWVSTSPWQSGKYVCYDLNKVFARGFNPDGGVSCPSLEIKADSFVTTPSFAGLLQFKSIVPALRRHIHDKTVMSQDSLDLLLAVNPHYYYSYELLGDYYKSIGNDSLAKAMWQNALTLALPKKQHKDALVKRLEGK